jgi:Na+/pantothenate symporter
MPTDLDAVSARRRAAKAHAQTKITMLSFWVIICVGVLGLLLKVFAQ